MIPGPRPSRHKWLAYSSLRLRVAHLSAIAVSFSPSNVQLYYHLSRQIYVISLVTLSTESDTSSPTQVQDMAQRLLIHCRDRYRCITPHGIRAVQAVSTELALVVLAQVDVAVINVLVSMASVQVMRAGEGDQPRGQMVSVRQGQAVLEK